MRILVVGKAGMVVGSRRALVLAYEAKRGNKGAKEALRQECRAASEKRKEKRKKIAAIERAIERKENQLAAKIEKLEAKLAEKLAAIAAIESAGENLSLQKEDNA